MLGDSKGTEFKMCIFKVLSEGNTVSENIKKTLGEDL